MTDVTIPSAQLPLVCGDPIAITGEVICGQVLAGDTYADFRLELGADPATLQISATLTTLSGLLELDGQLAALFTDIDLDATTGLLVLVGDVGVIVNPLLLPDVCGDLDLVALACLDLDLGPVAEQDLELEPAVCDQR